MTENNEIYFYVNGKPHKVKNPEPELTLIEYLRQVGLTGTKLGCAEGGCGACTVMISHYDKQQDKVINRSANACLFPLCAADRMHVITVEGIGSTKDVLHPVQEAMAKMNGSQCGFCTPGFVMSLYALLRNNPTPTETDVEMAIDGNLCRCTGYRPILDAAKQFVSKEKQQLCPSSGKPCSCKSVQPEKSSKKQTITLTEQQQQQEKDDTCALIGQKHLLFPAELKKLEMQELAIHGTRCKWFTPLTLNKLLQLKAQYPNAKLIAGNSELVIDVRLKNVEFPVYIYPMNIPELTKIVVADTGVHVGMNATLTHVMQTFKHLLHTLPNKYQTRILHAALSNLKWFASTPIRNVACMAGNIMTASPISDLNCIWFASNAILTCINSKHETRQIAVKDFIKDYRKTDIQNDEVAVSLFVPFTAQNEYVRAYKQAKRREDDIAIVNACLHVTVDESTKQITNCAISYGGMSKMTVFAKKAQAYLTGKVWNEQVLKEAFDLLLQDLPLDKNVPGGMPEYRRSLALGFFYKFYLYIQDAVYDCKVEKDHHSAIYEFTRPQYHAVQEFETKQQGTSVGKPENMLSAKLQVTGEAKYLDDIPKQKDELQGYFVLSSESHARIVNIDLQEALKMDGVHGYVSAEHVPGDNHFHIIVHDEELFRHQVVTSVGQPIGLIVADTLAQAKRAALKVKITYEKLSPVIRTIQDAMEHKSFMGFDHKLQHGSPDEQIELAKQNADQFVYVEGDINMGGQEHFYLEPQGSLAIPGEQDEMLIYSSTQNLTEVQKLCAGFLNVDQNKIIAKLKRIGGGFGGKETRGAMVAGACVVAANHFQRPVRIILDRDVDMSMTGQRHAFYAKYRASMHKQTNKLHTLHVHIYNNGGYSLDLSQSIMDRALFHIDNVYQFEHVHVHGYVCKTNMPSHTAFRGFGGPQGLFVCESILDHLARASPCTSHAIRSNNLYKANSVTHFGQVLFDGDRIGKLYQDCYTKSEYAQREQDIVQFNLKNKYRKRGISLIPTKFGISFTASFLNQGGALVHIYTDGSVLVTHGGVEMGQGLHTKCAQVAASTLGVDLKQVFINETSTDKVPNTSATAASVGSDLYGAAVLDACKQLNERLDVIRNKMLQEDASLKTVPWKALIQTAYMNRVNLSAQGFFKTPDIFMNWETGKGSPFAYFTYGAACSEVEIDTLTGDFHIIRSDIVMDVGDSLNPFVDIGQIEGAFVQGMGLFMMEELVWGDSAHQWVKPGALFTKGPGNYKIPSANDIPIDFRVHLMKNASNPKAVYSSKAIGEPPLFLGSSVLFAAKEAIAATRKKKEYFVLDSPATCQRIRMACQDVISEQVLDKEFDTFRAKGSF